MTLTEKWRKGELEQGWYYVLLFSNEEYITFIDGNWVVDDRLIGADIKEVLATVPTFDEYQQLIKFLEEFNALDVAEENEALKTKLSIQCEANEELRKENQQLKELLKECKTIIHESILGEYVIELCERITDAIGEKK